MENALGGTQLPICMTIVQHHHARRSYVLPERVHVCCDDAQVLCYDGQMTQLLQTDLYT